MKHKTCSDTKQYIIAGCGTYQPQKIESLPFKSTTENAYIICPQTGRPIQIVGVNENGQPITLDML